MAEKKNWAAATSNNPALFSRNDDRAVFHCVRLDLSSADASFGMGVSASTSESGDETRATELFTGRAVATMDLDGGMRGAVLRVPCSTLHNLWTQQKSNGDKCTPTTGNPGTRSSTLLFGIVRKVSGHGYCIQ